MTLQSLLFKIKACGLFISLFCFFSFNIHAQSEDVDFSDDYERIYQIRVVSPGAGSKSSIGSGFQVSEDGLIMTNYHVVSEFVNSPENYEIKYVTNDGKKGVLQLLDFDVVSDLALLRHPEPSSEYFILNTNIPEKGEIAYALGNPGDWGMVLVSGPTNGFVEHSYEESILFSGSLNPGMSGGPSLNKQGEVIGVNVATAGSQLSFLVPAKKALRLIKQERLLDQKLYQTEISEQIKAWQRPRLQELIDQEWALEEFSDRQLFGEIRRDFQCWGDTNDSDEERVTAAVDKTCSAGDEVYIAYDLDTGQISFSFSEENPLKLNAFQFGRSQEQYMAADNTSDYKHATNYLCETDFIQNKDKTDKGFTRVITCLRAFKQLKGLYDSLLLVQYHGNEEAFHSHLSLSGVEKDQIKAFNKRFVEASL